MPKSEDFTFRPVDLPNPIWLTSPENMFFIRLRKEGLSPVEAFVRASMKKREMEVKKRKRSDSTDTPASDAESTDEPLPKKTKTKKKGKSSSGKGNSDNASTHSSSKSTSTASKKHQESEQKPALGRIATDTDSPEGYLQDLSHDEYNSSSSKRGSTRKKSKAGSVKQSKGSEYELSNSDTLKADPLMKHTTLIGESEGTVEIYETCDEVRHKINAHLQGPGAPTKAAFLRNIAHAAYPDGSVKIQSKQLSDFLNQEGARTGSTSRVFYCAYVYFEKLRLITYLMDKTLDGIDPKDVDQDDAPKTEHRQDMEEEWGYEGGMPRERPHSYVLPAGYAIYTDDLGRIISAPEE